MMLSSADDRRVQWRLHLRSSPQRVFELLNSDEGRAGFWAESAKEVDGAIDFRFINGMRTLSPILDRAPPTRFALDYFDSHVVFELAGDSQGGTDLTVTNTDFDPADYEELLAGWLNVLFPLKAVADFGIDLRNHDPNRTWDKGYVDQ